MGHFTHVSGKTLHFEISNGLKKNFFPHFEDGLYNFPPLFITYFDPSPFKVLVL